MSDPRKINMIGKKFGRLLVIREAQPYPNGQARWLCKCDCGKMAVVEGGNLRAGRQVSCGCYNEEIRGVSRFRHGHTSHLHQRQSKEYTTWLNIRSRCYNPDNNRYQYYGARGIVVCPLWKDSFDNFLTDMGLKPSPDLSIDRINNDGNYEPGNCRWATRSEQRRNRRDYLAKHTAFVS